MKNFVVLLFLFQLIVANTQTVDWIKTWGGTLGQYGHAIDVDASGNVVSGGVFNSPLDIDPGSGVDSLFPTGGSGESDVWLQKLDAQGNYIWGLSFGGMQHDWIHELKIDNNQNVYVTGEVVGVVDLNPGPGVSNFGVVGQYSSFVLKLDSSGNFIWGYTIEGSPTSSGESIVVDGTGSVYVCGHFIDTADFVQGAGNFELISQGGQDIFIQKLDSSGSLKWAKSIGGPGFDHASGISLDNYNNLFVTGSFQDSVDFDPNLGVNTKFSNGLADVFIQKLDTAGNLIWVKTIGGVSAEVSRAIDNDSHGNVYLTGDFSLSVDFDPGIGVHTLSTSSVYSSSFVLKLDSSGIFNWAKSIEGAPVNVFNPLFVDASDVIYISGNFQDTVDFDPGGGTANMLSEGFEDGYLLKLDDNGNYAWCLSIGGIYADEISSIYSDGNGTILAVGHYNTNADLDPFTPISNQFPQSRGVFLEKLSPGNLSSKVNSSFAEETIPLVYPNPNTGSFFVDLGQIMQDVVIQVLDLNGRLVYRQFLNVMNNTRINFEAPNGMYYLIIRSNQGQWFQKIIKE